MSMRSRGNRLQSTDQLTVDIHSSQLKSVSLHVEVQACTHQPALEEEYHCPGPGSVKKNPMSVMRLSPLKFRQAGPSGNKVHWTLRKLGSWQLRERIKASNVVHT